MRQEREIIEDRTSAVAGISIKENILVSGSPLNAYSIDGDMNARVLWSNEGCTEHLTVSHDERSIASTSSNVIKLVDISSGRETRRLVDHSSRVTCVSSFSRSPYQWISGDEEGVCRVSDARRHPSTLISLRQSRPVRCTHSSPDDSLIVIGDDTCLQLYDMRQRKLLSRFIHSTTGVAFHPGERLMASFGDEGIIRYWDLDTLECVSQSEPFHDRIIKAHFSHQGDSLVVCSSDRIRCLSWEPCTLEWTESLPPSSSFLTSHLNKDDTVRLIVSIPHKNSIQILSSSLIDLDTRLRGGYHEVEEISGMVRDSQSPVVIPRTTSDIVLLNTPTQEERSIKIISHSPSANKLIKPTTRITLDDDRKKKMDERKGSVKRKEEKSNVDIMSMIDMEHSGVMEDLNGSWISLRGIKEACRKGYTQQAIDICVRDRSMAALCVLCRDATSRNGWNLSLSRLILPHLPLLLLSNHRELRSSALSSLSSIITAVGELVVTMTKNGAPLGIGVDVAAEERLAMSREVSKEFDLIQLRENDMMKIMSEDERTQLSAILALFPN